LYLFSERITSTCCQFVDLAMTTCEKNDKSTKENYNVMHHSNTHTNHRRRNVVIRKSLWALSGALRGMLLKEAGNDIPISFRESVLTKVLQRSMIQTDSRTILIATILPEIYAYEETMTTLRYINRLLHRPGQVVQSPFTAGISMTTSPLSSPFSSANGTNVNDESISSSLRMEQLANQNGRLLLKEIVSDPRQRLAKVLQPINHTSPLRPNQLDRKSQATLPEQKGQLQQQQGYVLNEEYIPSEYNDPEDDFPSTLVPPFQYSSPLQQTESQSTSSTTFLHVQPSNSTGENDDLIEIEDLRNSNSIYDVNDDDDTNHTALTPPICNVTTVANSYKYDPLSMKSLTTASQNEPYNHQNNNSGEGINMDNVDADNDYINTSQDNNASAIYEIFHRDYDNRPATTHHMNPYDDGIADGITYSKRSTNPFDNDDDDDDDDDDHNSNNLNESHTLDVMAAHVANNQFSYNDHNKILADADQLYGRHQITSINEEIVDDSVTNFQGLDDVLRKGNVEEEIVFTNSQPSVEANDNQYEAPINHESDDIYKLSQPLSKSSVDAVFMEINENSEEVPSLLSENESLFMAPKERIDPSMDQPRNDELNVENNDLFAVSPYELPHRDTKNVMGSRLSRSPQTALHASNSEGGEPSTNYDLPPESPLEETTENSAPDHNEEERSTYFATNTQPFNPYEYSKVQSLRGDGFNDFLKSANNISEEKLTLESPGVSVQPLLNECRLPEKGDSLLPIWKQSPIEKLHISNSLSWNEKIPVNEPSLLSDVAAQKVKDEIDQLQAAVDKVKQTNISVWQSSLDSINNLRYFQTAHQEALAQLLVEREIAGKEIQRLDTELNRRDADYRNSIVELESKLEAAYKQIGKVEADRGEVVKIAEEAIGMQSELEQKVAELEHELSVVTSSRVPREEYNSLEQQITVLQDELYEKSAKLSDLSEEVNYKNSSISQLEFSLKNAESKQHNLFDEIATYKNEVTSLNELLIKAQRDERHAQDSASEMKQYNEELQARQSEYLNEIQKLKQDLKLNDEYATQCRQDLDVTKMKLLSVEEEAKVEIAKLEDEVFLRHNELTELQMKNADYPAKLNEYEQECAALQVEKNNLVEELREAKASLQSRVNDVRELTESVKVLINEKEKDKAKIQRMEKALASFQEETRSRLETVLQHRNEAASLLEKTVNENKALVNVNVELQTVIEALQHERNKAELDLQECDYNYSTRLENATKENTALMESNQQLTQEINELRQKYYHSGNHHNATESIRVAERGDILRGTTSHQAYRNGSYGNLDERQHSNNETRRGRPFDEEINNHHGIRRNTMDNRSAQLERAEDVAAHVAYSAKALLESNTSETYFLKEKIYAIEDDKDYEINSLKQRIKQLERRIKGGATK
jgi:hypothetical protein